jgi:nucleoredoxin
MKELGKSFECVFVSSDKDEGAFKEYFDEMPGLLAMPFGKRDLKNKLSKQLKVRGIPTLAFADGKTGEVYTTNGREVFMSDPEGDKYPWKPPTLKECLGTSFVRNDGTQVPLSALEGKHLAIYFSASWCPPCKGFTVPVLKPCYEHALEKGHNWEIIYVSADKDDESFKSYFGEMPWLAVPFDDKQRAQDLNSHFGVEGIPTLIQLGPDFSVVNKALRGAVSADPQAENFPWAPKPVQELEEGVAEINDTPALICLMEDEGETTQAQFQQILAQIAEEHLAKVKAGTHEETLFLKATQTSQVLGKIRQLTKLTASEGVRTLCNGDMCMKLNSSTAVLLLDIPDEGGFYTLDGELTKENIIDFFTKWVSGDLKGSRQQLE